jgi:RNA-binding protein
MSLTGKQRRALRALGHHLSAVVQVGHQGVTDGVIAALDDALYTHELIKVKLGEGVDDRHDIAKELSERTQSELAQVLGRTVLLFKKREEKSKFESL